MTNLEKGDLKAAEETLTKAAEGPKPTREVFYNLGEVKFAKGQHRRGGHLVPEGRRPPTRPGASRCSSSRSSR